MDNCFSFPYCEGSLLGVMSAIRYCAIILSNNFAEFRKPDIFLRSFKFSGGRTFGAGVTYSCLYISVLGFPSTAMPLDLWKKTRTCPRNHVFSAVSSAAAM